MSTRVDASALAMVQRSVNLGRATLNTGVAEAWTLLQLAGRLTPDNTVRIAIIDSGFAVNDDFPALHTAEATNSADDPLGTKNPNDNCTNSACDWHGTVVVGAGAGVPDNRYGGAGPAGPIAEIITIHTEKGRWGHRSRSVVRCRW